MNTPKAVVILSTLALATVGALLYMAMLGNPIATGVLFSIWTIVCVTVGWLLSIIQQGRAAAKEQRNFMDNARENLAIMGAMQSVQNKQNQALLSQLGSVARLPQAAPPADSLLIEDAIFSELEQ